MGHHQPVRHTVWKACPHVMLERALSASLVQGRATSGAAAGVLAASRGLGCSPCRWAGPAPPGRWCRCSRPPPSPNTTQRLARDSGKSFSNGPLVEGPARRVLPAGKGGGVAGPVGIQAAAAGRGVWAVRRGAPRGRFVRRARLVVAGGRPSPRPPLRAHAHGPPGQVLSRKLQPIEDPGGGAAQPPQIVAIDLQAMAPLEGVETHLLPAALRAGLMGWGAGDADAGGHHEGGDGAGGGGAF